MLFYLTLLGFLASTLDCVQTVPKHFSIPVRREPSLHRRDGNEATATQDVVVDFTFGRQIIPVSLDSGSTFTYVASTLDTHPSETSILPTLFNPNTSSTYHDENDPNDAFSCDGNDVDCFMGVDNIATAGLTANGMSFGVAKHVKPGVFGSGQAGTLGFGRQADDPSTWLPRDQPFWLRAGAGLEEPYLFTVDIYNNQNGTFDFGYIDTAKFTGDITFGSIDTSRTNWNIKLTGFAIGSGANQTVETFTGVVDTGGPNIGLPTYVVNPYFDSIGGAPSPGNSHTYPCSAYPPPDLVLQLADGGQLVLDGTFLVEPPDGSSETCNGRLDDSEQTAYNLGASVLDQKFVVFDHANARIGFADKRRDGQPEGTTPTSIASSASSTMSSATATISTAMSPSPTPNTGGTRIHGIRGGNEHLGMVILAHYIIHFYL